MKIKNKKGFTLIELLAVIVILGIIALIAVPIVTNIIKDSKKKSFETSANGLVESAKIYYSSKAEDLDFEGKTFKFGDKLNIKGLKIKGKNPKDGEVIVNTDGEIKMYVTDGEYCAFKDFESNVITISEGTECSDHPETPIINGAYNMVTTNRVALIAECKYESGDKIEIEKYEFSKDGGKTWNYKTENNEYLNYYTYDDLKQDTEYNFMARCVTKVGSAAEIEIEVPWPTIVEKIIVDVPDGWAMEKEVVISYPKGRYTYQYQELDNIDDTINEDNWKIVNDEETEWEEVKNHKNSSTHNVFSKKYKENKYVILRVVDGAGNYIDSASTSIQKIDRTPPVCGKWTGNSTWTNKSVIVKVACNETQDEINNISGCTASSYNVKTYSTTTKTADLSYTIKDNAGNTTECSDTVDVYVDTTAPSLDLGIASTTTSTITIPIVTNEDSDSGIKNTTCEYGTSTSYGKTGSIDNNTCTISGVTAGTTYYYKVVTTNEAGISTTKTGSVKRPTAKTLTYTGSAQTLINAGSSSDGTIEYKLGSAGTYSTELPKATDAGTYTVYYRITKDGYDTVTDNISVVISKKADTITLTAKTYTYDGSEKTATVTTESGVTPKVTYYSNSSCTVSATPKNAGVYYAKVTTDGNTNYNTASKGCTKAVTINKANNTLKISPTNNTYTYPDSKTFEVIENTSDGSLSCETSNSSVATCSINGNIITVKPGTTEGSATITVKSDETDNYNATQAAHVATTAKGTIPSITANGKTVTYDGKAHGITVSTTLAEATIKYGTCDDSECTKVTYAEDSSVSPTLTDVGTKTVYYEISAPGYNTVTGRKTIVIIKAPGRIAKTATARTLIYTGSAQTLINAGSSDTGTILYKLGTNGDWSEDLPSATDAGTYIVQYVVIGDNNHKDTSIMGLTVTINKASGRLLASPSAKSLIYTGNPQTLISVGRSDTGTILYRLGTSGDWSTSLPTATEPGEYIVYYYVKGDDNHYDVSARGIKSIINKKPNPLSINPTNNTYTYPTSKTFTIYNNLGGGALSCESNDTSVATCSISGTTVTVKPGTTEGSATITVKSAETTYYKAGQAAHLATTAKGTIPSITANGYNGTYDGKEHGITVSTTLAGASIKYSKTGSDYKPENPTYDQAGTYIVYYEVSAPGYHTVYGNRQVIINKAEPPIKVTAKTLTYTGSTQSLVTVSGAQGAVYYNVGTSLTSSNYSTAGSTSIPTKTNGGTYTVYYYAVATNNYNAKSGSVSVKISSIPDEITITSQTYKYDGSIKAAKVTTESGLTPTVTYYSDSSCSTVSTPKNAGTYYAKATTTGNANYNAASKGCTKAVVIETIPNTLTISASSATYTYPTSGTFTVTKNTSGGTLSCSSSNNNIATCSVSGTTVTVKPGTTQGAATITVKSAATTNYNAASVAHVATTAAGLCSITANGNTVTYDGKAHGIIASSSNCTLKFGTSSGSYTQTTSPTYTNVGTYTVYYQVTGAGYTTATGSRQVIINKASGSVNAPSAKSLTYTGKAQTLINAGSSSTGTIQYKLNNGSYSTSLPSATESATYTVYYRVIGDSNHNDVAENSIHVTIKYPVVSYTVKLADDTWLTGSNGFLGGTVGKSMAIEQLRASISAPDISGGISYSIHQQDVGDVAALKDGKDIGTDGKRIERVTFSLYGDLANTYDLYYRVHVQGKGWLKTVSNGAETGSEGLCKRIEAVQLQLVPKGASKPTFDDGGSNDKDESISIVTDKNSSNCSTSSSGGTTSCTNTYCSYNYTDYQKGYKGLDECFKMGGSCISDVTSTGCYCSYPVYVAVKNEPCCI